MLNRLLWTILFLVAASFLFSCSSKNISSKYYYQHEKALDRIEESYKKLYLQKPFTIAFTDRSFNTVSVQIITDTLSYIYEFQVNESRLIDTLVAYQFNAPKIFELIQQMQSIHCTWVNKLDYYVDETKHTLIFMSIKPTTFQPFFSYKKYFTLTYFQQPQYFDSTGQLLDKKRLRRLRKINGEIFNRINDKVCYTISGSFR